MYVKRCVVAKMEDEDLELLETEMKETVEDLRNMSEGVMCQMTCYGL